jgi:hypothetical protein
MLCVPRAKLITKREAAEMLGVSPSAVQRMMDRREINVHSTVSSNGKAVAHLFSVAEVERVADRRAAA